MKKQTKNESKDLFFYEFINDYEDLFEIHDKARKMYEKITGNDDFDKRLFNSEIRPLNEESNRLILF